jgi:hypothetical protein
VNGRQARRYAAQVLLGGRPRRRWPDCARLRSWGTQLVFLGFRSTAHGATRACAVGANIPVGGWGGLQPQPWVECLTRPLGHPMSAHPSFFRHGSTSTDKARAERGQPRSLLCHVEGAAINPTRPPSTYRPPPTCRDPG